MTSNEINERMEASKIIEVEINETRNLYVPISIRGSILYFVIADLSRINDMYQNSLQFVKSLFVRAIKASPLSDDIDKRLAILIDNITRMIFTNVSRGLFERDKITFSFLISTSILRNVKAIDEVVWNIFLRGPSPFTSEEANLQLESPDMQMID